MATRNEQNQVLDAWAEIAIVATAALARLFNLGSFSMWLDEILGQVLSRGTLGQTWAASRSDAVHPPLANLIAWGMRSAGAGEHAQRLVPIACGVVTVLVLARWAARHFGARVGVFAGFLAAVSPLAVRYSQELRPYPYLLLFVVLTLVALDRLVERPGAGAVLGLSLALAGGLYSHYFFPLVLIPGVMLILTARPGATTVFAVDRRVALGALAAAGIATLAYLPWLGTLVALGRRTAIGGVAGGALDVGLRWQFLAVGAHDGDPLSWSAVFALVVVAVGIWAGARSAPGRVVAVGALAGIAGAELLLRVADHWSNARYDLVGLPFLIVLAALGLDLLARPLPDRVRTAAVVVPLSVAATGPLAQYDRRGRPHWDRVAATIRALRGPGEPVFTENDWTRISLGYYLFGPTLEPQSATGFPFASASAGAASLARLWPADTCALFVTGGFPERPEVRSALQGCGRLAAFFFTDGTAIVLVTPERRHALFERGLREIGDGVAGQSPCSGQLRIIPPALRQADAGRLDSLPGQWRRLRRSFLPDPERLEFDPVSTEQALVYGWAGWERSPRGETYVWATGRTAILALTAAGSPPRVIRMRVWPMLDAVGTQRMTPSLNGQPLPAIDLRPGPQVVELPLGQASWVAGENLLRFDFAHCRSPHDVDPALGDTRPLALAFDWLEPGQ